VNLFRRPENTDWLAHYNALLERHGESAAIGSLHWQKATGEVKESHYNHTAIDGMGAMAHGLRTLWGYTEDELPRASFRQPPTLRSLLPQLVRFAWNEVRAVPALPWKKRYAAPPFHVYGKGYRIFSVEETEALVKRARKLKGTYNTLVLHAFNRAVNEVLQTAPCTNRWHVPVQVGGMPGRGQENVNRMSNFVQEVGWDDSVEAITQEQFRHFRAGTHYATLFFLNLGDFRGFKNFLSRKVAADYRRPSVSGRITGTFSSLGAWPKKGAPNRNDWEVLIPFGNVSLKNPICTVNLIWHGQLAMSLQLHSSIANPADVEAVMEAWVRNLRSL
jgi:hypothetical protein